MPGRPVGTIWHPPTPRHKAPGLAGERITREGIDAADTDLGVGEARLAQAALDPRGQGAVVEIGVCDDCYGDAAWCLADLVFAYGGRLQQRCCEDGGVHGEVAVAEPVIGTAVDGRARNPAALSPAGVNLSVSS